MKTLTKYKTLYLMVLPVLVYFSLFSFYPLVKGLISSTQKVNLIGERPFIGLENYLTVLNDPNFWQVLTNTLIIGLSILILGFIAPIVVALSLNEVFRQTFKKLTQMIIYVPHLFSWVVVGGIFIQILSPDGGLINEILKLFGQTPINFLLEEKYARSVIVLSTIWKDMGFYCILYLATIVSIDPTLYEAARIDGANRWQQMRSITLPSLVSTMKVVIMLNVMSILRIFDQIIMMSNSVIAKKVEVLMTYTYQKGILEFDIGIATAAGFIVIFATLLISYVISKIIRYD